MRFRYTWLCAAGAVALGGASFWQNKPVSEWDQKEIHTILTRSPWAKEITVSPGGSIGGQSTPDAGGGRRGRGGQNGGLAGNGVEGASVGMGRPDTGMGGGGGRGGGAGADGMDTPRAAPSFKFIVRWMALPVQEAMRRLNGAAKAAGQDTPPPEYLLTVTGIPAQLVMTDGERLKQRLKEATSLRRKDQDSISPDKIEFIGNEQAVVAVFHFPRQPAITADDKQVEFVSTLGRLELRAKFNLKDMTYNGKLEL